MSKPKSGKILARIYGGFRQPSTNRPSLRKLFEEAAVRSAYPRTGRLHGKAWVISLGAVAAGSLAPRAAAGFFTRPLKILVENRFTDGLFVDAVLAFLAPDELRDFLAQCQGEPLIYDSGGGTGELQKLIDAHAREMVGRGLPPRAIAFTDSDAHFPGEVTKKAAAIARACKNHDIDHLVLSKRAIENYLPDEVLLGWAGEPANSAARPRVEAVCGLTPTQRDHLAMKRQFPQQFQGKEERVLFASVPPADSALMQERGFSDRLIELLETHREFLSADALRRRDRGGDLDRLVTMIVQAL